jgi:hypothetical protein
MRRALLGIVALSVACGGQDAGSGDAAPGDTAGAAGAGGAAASTGPTGTAVVNGTIAFTGTPPANPTIDMSEEAECAAKYTAPPVDSQYVVGDGKLGNVFVYVKSGLPAGATWAPPSEPVVIDQQGCIYHPRVFGIQVGQPLEIRNSDPLLHNIKAVPTANRGFNISQPSAGMKTTRTFNTAEVMVPLECNVHGWMNAHVGVVPHPFYATTTADGRFEIRGLPAGTYTIEAWHEKLGTQTMDVTVGDGETKTADFSFAPRT